MGQLEADRWSRHRRRRPLRRCDRRGRQQPPRCRDGQARQELGGLHARQRGAGAQAGRLLRRRLRRWLTEARLTGLLTGGVHPAHSPPHRGRCAAGARLLVPVRPSCRGAPARGPRYAVGSHDRARAAVWRMVRAGGALHRAAQPDLRLRRQVPRPARLATGSRQRSAGELRPRPPRSGPLRGVNGEGGVVPGRLGIRCPAAARCALRGPCPLVRRTRRRRHRRADHPVARGGRPHPRSASHRWR